jgi:hypothetical protein
MDGFRGGIIQGVLLYTITPWKTPRKSMGEWDYRTMKDNTSFIVYETGPKSFVTVELWHSIPRVAFLAFTKTNKILKRKIKLARNVVLSICPVVNIYYTCY